MEQFSAYTLIIGASIVVMLSFFFSALAKKTNIPAVLMLIALGVGLQYLLKYLGVGKVNFFPVLEVLGIVGLIMIVLEAALELKLELEKVGIIIKSLLVGMIGLGCSVGAASVILFYLVPCMTWPQAILYATPLSILSSAIIIPSVGNLVDSKKEFHVYESTFSDILGIMLFYFLISFFEPVSGVADQGAPGPVQEFFVNLLITLAISLVASYILLFVFQRIEEKAKLFVLISVLLLLYAVAKMFHLSPLIIILIFGLAVSNSKLFFRGWLKKLLHQEKFKEMEHGLHSLTAETAFIVRTFFFVIFGASILLSSLFSLEVAKVSAAIFGSIYIIRWVLLKIFVGKDIYPQIWIAPRGLITVLLFYAIPVEFQAEMFDPGILLFIIIASGVVMTAGLISDSMDDEEDEIDVTGESKYILTPVPNEGRYNRLLRKAIFYYKTRFWYKIIRHPQYVRFRKKASRIVRALARSLGIRLIYNPENKNFLVRLKNVLAIVRYSDRKDLEKNEDYQSLKKYIHRIIYDTDTVEGILFDIVLFGLIIASVVLMMLESLQGISRVWIAIFKILEVVITIFFTVEYALRIWTIKRPKKYIFSFFGIIDLLSILPLYLELIFTNAYSLGVIRIFRLLRIFRVLKLVQFVGEAQFLLRALKQSANKIVVFLFFVLVVCTVMGAVMFFVEGPENGFTSIPRSIYWAVVTLTTVGYGDIHPMTFLGQLFAMFLMIMGYGVIAVPTGLVAAEAMTVSKEEIKKSIDTKTCQNCSNSDQLKEAKFCTECGAEFEKVDS